MFSFMVCAFYVLAEKLLPTTNAWGFFFELKKKWEEALNF